LTPGPRRAAAVLLAFALPGNPQVPEGKAGRWRFRVDESLSFPGGILQVQLGPSPALRGAAYALLNGHRSAFYPAAGGPRALVPVSATTRPGEATLGVEVRSGRRAYRDTVIVTIPPREYPPRHVSLGPEGRERVARSTLRDGRPLLELLRTVSPVANWNGPFLPPVEAPPVYSYGAPTTYDGGGVVEARLDGLHGEHHRGMDYPTPAGTTVRAPARGQLLLTGHFSLSGGTVLIDHGQGVVSALFHLSQVQGRPGDMVETGAPVGLSGDTGVAGVPQVHWGVYVRGVAVDPRVMQSLPR
jgi:murein DD-endopeptidase MepM/ murein hydrolase activator NlpD